MTALFKIKVDKKAFTSLDRLMHDIERAMVKIASPARAMRRFKVYQIARWALNFTEEGQVYGTKWKPLSAFTIAERGSSGPILRRGGNLFANVVEQNNAGEVHKDGVFWHIVNSTSERGDGRYPLTHQYGMNPNPLDRSGMGVPEEIPTRPIWDLDDEDADMALHFVVEDVEVALHSISGR